MRVQWLAALLSLSVLAAATPAPLPGSEEIVVRDPAIWYNADLGKYFVFATREGIKIYTAPSLKGSVISPHSYTPPRKNFAGRSGTLDPLFKRYSALGNKGIGGLLGPW
ncbi:hypothetical protein EV122DRAFT_283763 [Schizophyllum commune]